MVVREYEDGGIASEERRGESDEAGFDLGRGIESGGAVEVRAGRSGGRRRCWHSCRCAWKQRERLQSGKPRSSATSWRMRVCTPWPISVAPVVTITLPSV